MSMSTGEAHAALTAVERSLGGTVDAVRRAYFETGTTDTTPLVASRLEAVQAAVRHARLQLLMASAGLEALHIDLRQAAQDNQS